MESTSNLRIFGYENESVNGSNIKDQGFDLNYNGEYADLNVFNKGTTNYQLLSKGDILNIMGMPSSPITLEERLTLMAESENENESKTPFHRTPTPYPYQVIKSPQNYIEYNESNEYEPEQYKQTPSLNKMQRQSLRNSSSVTVPYLNNTINRMGTKRLGIRTSKITPSLYHNRKSISKLKSKTKSINKLKSGKTKNRITNNTRRRNTRRRNTRSSTRSSTRKKSSTNIPSIEKVIY